MKIFRYLLHAVFVLFLCYAATPTVRAGTFGLFTYTDNGSSITITDYPESATGEVEIPAAIDSKPVTSIGSNAFQACTGLTSVTIPDSVTIIGNWAFENCSSLTSVTIGNSVISIGGVAFANCLNLTSVTIPDSVTSVEDAAFRYCTGLTSVTIGSGVTSIGSYAFDSCTGLTSVTIPDSVTSIGSYAFADCAGLSAFTVNTLNSSYSSENGVLFNKNLSLLVAYPGGKAGSYAMPVSVTSVGDGAFQSCTGLTSVTIPVSVSSIGVLAFQSCTGLTSVTIPDSVTSIENYVFQSCSGLTSVSIGNSVTSIGNNAFQSCTGLTSVTIPNSVTSMGYYVFQACSGLTSLSIGSGITSISRYAFESCTGLTSVTIPDSVTSIGDNAFRSCTGLTSVSIGRNVTTIGEAAFQSCTGLTRVTIPNSVTSMGNYVFQACSGLTSLSIGSGITSISRYAFESCTGLTSVTIPNSVTSINRYAFRFCTKLITIYIKGNPPQLDVEVFSWNPKANVYYLLGTTGWDSTYGVIDTVALGLPVITGQVSSIIANVGDAVSFSVITQSSFPLTLSYQWQKNGVVIPGAATASLHLSNIQSADVGNYTVIITSDAGSVTSTATLTLSQGNLYTQAQYDAALQTGLNAGMAAGRTQVTDFPNNYGLYSLNQVQALNVGTPLLTRDQVSGKFKLTIGVKKSTDLSTFTAFPISTGAAVINANGEVEFQFTSPDKAAFYRLESH